MLIRELFENAGEVDIVEMMRLIKEQCQPWLKITRGEFALRGANMQREALARPLNEEKKFYVVGVRNDRKPKDSPLWLHHALNDHFVKKIGIPLRSTSVFAIKSFSSAYNYSPDVYAIFPIGEVHYAWAKQISDPSYIFLMGMGDEQSVPDENDAFFDLINLKFMEFLKQEDPEVFKRNKYMIHDIADWVQYDQRNASVAVTSDLWQKFVTEFISSNNFWTFDKGFSQIPEEHEMMIVCDKYYAVHYKWIDEIKTALKK